MMFVIIFVVFLYGVDRINLNDPTKSGGGCINSLREEGVLPLHAQLEFAFELSWTTFTTVGYGVSDAHYWILIHYCRLWWFCSNN